MSTPKNDFLSLDPAIIVGRVFAGVGAISLIIIGLLVWQDQKTARNSSKVIGTVSSLDYSSSGTAAPVIGFRFNGKKHFYHGTVWTSPPSFDVGEEVELLVNNNRPDDVIVNSFFERYFMISLVAFLATVFGAIGTALLVFMKK